MSWSDKLLELCENYQEALENYQTPNKRVKKTDVKEVLPPVTTKEAEETPTATTTAAAAAAAATAATAAATTTTTTTTTAGAATLTTTTGATTPTTTTTTTTFTENDKQVICGLMNNETSEDFDDFYPEFKKNNPLIVQAILNSKSNNDKNISEKDFVMNYINKLVCKERGWFSITTPKNNVIFKTHEQFMKDSIRSLTNDFFSEYNPYANLQFDYFYNTFLNEENENLFKKLQDDKKNNTNDDIFKYINTLNNNKVLNSNLFLDKSEIKEKLREYSCAAYNTYITKQTKNKDNFYYFYLWFIKNNDDLHKLILENKPEDIAQTEREYIKIYFNNIDCVSLFAYLNPFYSKIKFTKDEKLMDVSNSGIINLISNVVQAAKKSDTEESDTEEDAAALRNKNKLRIAETKLYNENQPQPSSNQEAASSNQQAAPAVPAAPPSETPPPITSTRTLRSSGQQGAAAPPPAPSVPPAKAKRNASSVAAAQPIVTSTTSTLAQPPPLVTQPKTVPVTAADTKEEEVKTCKGVVDKRCENIVHGWSGPRDTNYQLDYKYFCTEQCKQKNRCVFDQTFCELDSIATGKFNASINTIYPNQKRTTGYKTLSKASYPKSKVPN